MSIYTHGMEDKAREPDEPTLFALPPAMPPAPAPAPADPKRGARLREANRSQLAWGRIDLDAQLPDDHPARAICAVIERLDLSALYVPIEARHEVAGAGGGAARGSCGGGRSCPRGMGGSAAASGSPTTR